MAVLLLKPFKAEDEGFSSIDWYYNNAVTKWIKQILMVSLIEDLVSWSSYVTEHPLLLFHREIVFTYTKIKTFMY